jgi:uncharacterized protein DUF1854
MPSTKNPHLSPQEREATVRLERRTDGRLVARRAAAATPVRPVRCFPWSGPAGYISLRDDDHQEVALVADLADLDHPSRCLLEEDLAQAGFVLQVVRIGVVKEELEIRTWKVETQQGPRTFQTARDEWPRPLPGGGLLLRDAAGDLYLIPPPAQLDARTRRILWAFVD